MLITLLDLLLVLYLISLFSIIFLLNKSVHKFKDYIRKGIWVSDLGRSNKASAKYFNTTIKLYGLLSIPLTLKFALIFPEGFNYQVMSVILLSISIFTLVIGFLPMNKWRVMHEIMAGLCFGSVVAFSVFAIIENSISYVFPLHLILLNYAFLIFTPITAVGNLMYFFRIKTRKFKWLIILAGKFEWVILFITIAWNISMATFLLME